MIAARYTAKLVPKKAGYWWLHILFFVSGFPALLYQIIWQRALFAIYGVNIESVTVVVSAFMVGLGLGSLAGGWLSRRDAPQLVIFALIELSIASFGVISLRLFHWVASFTAGAPAIETGLITLGSDPGADDSDGRDAAGASYLSGPIFGKRRALSREPVFRQHAGLCGGLLARRRSDHA